MTRFTIGRMVVPSMNQPPYASPGSPISFNIGKMPDIGPTTASLGVYSVSIKNVGFTPIFFRGRSGSTPTAGQSPYSYLHIGHTGTIYFQGSPNKDLFVDLFQYPNIRYISFADNAYTNDYPGQVELDD